MSMSKEEHILNNFDRVIDNATNEYVRNLWSIKKYEYLRQLRWEVTEMMCNTPNMNYRGYIGDEFQVEAD